MRERFNVGGHAIYSLPQFHTPMFRALVGAMKECFTESMESADIVGVDAQMVAASMQNMAASMATILARTEKMDRQSAMDRQVAEARWEALNGRTAYTVSMMDYQVDQLEQGFQGVQMRGKAPEESAAAEEGAPGTSAAGAPQKLKRPPAPTQEPLNHKVGRC